MKGIYFDGKKASYREDLPKPEPAPGHVRIRVLRADVCSTDKEILRGYRPDFSGIMGHEFAGIIDAVGEPDSANPSCLDATGHDLRNLVGALVVGELNEGCGHCLYCRSGREKHCPDRRVLGIGADGCFAEYMTLADHLVHEVPEGLSPETAVYTEPLAAALEIPKQVHIDPDRNVAVIGDGRLAYLIAQVLSLTGADLTVIGKHEEKLQKFKPIAHVRTIDSFGLNLESEAYADPASHYEPDLSHVAQDTYEVVVDASGNPSGLDLAARITRRMGTIVLKSTYAGAATVDMSHLVVNEITIVGSRCGPFAPALQLLAKGLIRLPEVEWHDLADYEAAFASRAFKAGFVISER
ncbi:MAG: alcohol dehydrogenase catalytic domain-containing protein [Firmicutes bacterium]|nr:alcohol dehydrogenase catalytic domain-containing protein [Bacillota bacterium]